MEAGGFAPLGLLLAAAMSVTNVMTDVWRKRALDQRDLFPATFWIRIAVAVVFAVVLLVQILRGEPIVIRDGGLLRGGGHGVDAVDHPHPVQIAVDAQVQGRHSAAPHERNVDHAIFLPRHQFHRP